ncbi:cyclopropane-fatty-acyl-phospholipid synthase [Luteipulveratus sp. YIM 133132]|uniref:SAM-dependent methyltransferase n=1 Tax=Luteipulveratus flavus TaxID=3031728 RepID=UPI0023AEA505|nr:cyclopropane-fatty-acyl-phospholipid synthase family protein [Luteipulveratus sp. YIM 133132]MDE9366182.1 cyclopropane-fatty-acyl-phospholipid synthase [Luteipulveratus sp. YIM 133132]
MSAAPVAPRLAELLAPLAGGELPVRIRAWDGSTAGPAGVPVVHLRSPQALRRMLWHPGELGAAQAYVAGELAVDGDLADGLRHLWAQVRGRGLTAVRPSPRLLAQAARLAREWDVLGAPPAMPSTQIAVTGRLHSMRRDKAVIHHHYDLSNAFYALVLDAHLAYSCAYVTGADLDGGETSTYSLEDAQRDKLDLVCRKLGLDAGPGMRLLDVGCGWGSLTLHAAQAYGASVTGITISQQQKAFIEQRVRERGLQDRVTVRLQDYREIADPPYDAVASLEMGEHVGERNYPTYAATLARCVRADGRVLIQQMSRSGRRNRGGGPFIEAFIAPDMTMRPVGETVNHLESAGLEVRDVHALREHYAWTVRAWQARFDRNRERILDLVGAEVVRVWELYLAGGLLSFEQGRMGVDQILAVRRGDGPSPLPPVRPTGWSVPYS